MDLKELTNTEAGYKTPLDYKDDEGLREAFIADSNWIKWRAYQWRYWFSEPAQAMVIALNQWSEQSVDFEKLTPLKLHEPIIFKSPVTTEGKA